MTEEQQKVWTALQKDYNHNQPAETYETYYKRNPGALIQAIWTRMTLWEKIKFRVFGKLPISG